MKTEHGRGNLVCAGFSPAGTTCSFLFKSAAACVNAHCAHPHSCAGADIIGSSGGSLDTHGLRAAPLKNFPCNSSDLLSQHWLFFITSSGISFSFCHSGGKRPLVL